MANRNGKVILAKNIKLEKSYKNVLDYTDQQMLELVIANKVYEANDFSFINRDERNYVQIDISYTDAIKANYLAYQNPDYGGKWFFAFIDKVEYYSESSTRIRFTIDEFSTWYGYWGVSTCFVEREHVNDDTIGLHTIPEGLETGEYIINESSIVTRKLDRDACYICMGVTYVPDGTLWVNDDRMYGHIYSGLTLVIFKSNESCSKFIKVYDKMGRGDAIVNIYMIPVASSGIAIDDERWQNATYQDISNITFAVLPSTGAAYTIEENLTYTIPSTLNGYTPRNNKLKVFPYNYISISNNNGSQIDYHYEDFVNNTAKFNIIGIPTNGGQNMMIPVNYKLINSTSLYDIHYNYGISGGKFPSCSWNTDPYINWLTQNGVNIMGMKIDAPTTQAISGSLEALVGAGTLNSENIGGGIGKMFGAVQEQWRHSLQSPTLNGQTSSGDICFANDNCNFVYYKMSIRAEYARIIDEWFTRFGYKVNRLKTPNITGRTYWNFVKIGANEDIGYANNNYFDIPAPSMEIINNIFRNGVTIWHDHSNIGNFTLNNTIVA